MKVGGRESYWTAGYQALPETVDVDICTCVRVRVLALDVAVVWLNNPRRLRSVCGVEVPLVGPGP